MTTKPGLDTPFHALANMPSHEAAEAIAFFLLVEQGYDEHDIGETLASNVYGAHCEGTWREAVSAICAAVREDLSA